MDARWIDHFFDMANCARRMSRDPSTQVGAVLVRPDKTIVSTGFNGFPRGVVDDPALYEDKAQKYPRVVHAELNAILSARECLHGYSLFVTPLPPCPHCAGAIIQSGVSMIYWRGPEVPERWSDQMKIASEMFREAHVHVTRL